MPRLIQEFPLPRNLFNPDFSSREEFVNAIDALTISAQNADFLNLVNDALTLSKTDYVAAKLDGYYREEDKQDESARKLAIRLFGVSVPIAGIAYIEYLFHFFH
jgi:hypothetical protein